MSRRKNLKSKNDGAFVALPHRLIETEDFRNLSGSALRLLIALTYQYRGNNNGDLTAAFSIMKKFGFKSKETLTKAKRDLLQARMIVQTRHSKFLNPGGKCALFALAWRPIDECKGKKLEVAPTYVPPRRLSLEKN